jgi:hypothetical protein
MTNVIHTVPYETVFSYPPASAGDCAPDSISDFTADNCPGAPMTFAQESDAFEDLMIAVHGKDLPRLEAIALGAVARSASHEGLLGPLGLKIENPWRPLAETAFAALGKHGYLLSEQFIAAWNEPAEIRRTIYPNVMEVVH